MEEAGKGGYQAVADMVSAMFRYPVPRQQVHSWWARRNKNKFPEGEKTGTTRQFVLADVEKWFRDTYPDSRIERLRCQRQERAERRTSITSDESMIA